MLDNYNLTMLTDFYEITMANGYFHSDVRDYEACFDMFFRRVPDQGGYAIMAGLEQVIEYLPSLLGEVGDIAAVDSNAHLGRLHLFKYLDGIRKPRF